MKARQRQRRARFGEAWGRQRPFPIPLGSLWWAPLEPGRRRRRRRGVGRRIRAAAAAQPAAGHEWDGWTEVGYTSGDGGVTASTSWCVRPAGVNVEVERWAALVERTAEQCGLDLARWQQQALRAVGEHLDRRERCCALHRWFPAADGGAVCDPAPGGDVCCSSCPTLTE